MHTKKKKKKIENREMHQAQFFLNFTLTITTQAHIEHVPHLYVDHPEETLVPLFEFPLVKHLDRNHTLIRDLPK